MGTEDGKLETARSLIYQIIGTLCKKIDFSEYDAKTALFKLFWGLCYDTHGVRLVIQKVILELFPLLKNAKLTDNYEQSIIDLTLECITGNNYEALYCLVLFINSVFSFNSIEAKYINIVAIKRSKHGLEEAGYNGLKFPDPPRMPEKEEDINYTIRKWRERLPNFLEFIGLLSQLMRGKNTYKLKYYDAIAKVENVEKEKFFGAVTMGTLTLGLEFSRQLFILSADPWANRSCLGTVGTLGTNETWIEGVSLIQRVTDYIKYLCTPADNIQQEYRTNENIYVKPGRHRSTAEMPSLEAYTNLVLRALRSPQSENILKIVCIHILTEIIHYLPRTILNSLYEDIQLLESMLSSMNPQVSHGSARLIGALVTKSPYVEAKNNQFVKLVEKLMADSVRPEKKMVNPTCL